MIPQITLKSPPLQIPPLTKEATLRRKAVRGQELHWQRHRFIIQPRNATGLPRKLVLASGWACVFYAKPIRLRGGEPLKWRWDIRFKIELPFLSAPVSHH